MAQFVYSGAAPETSLSSSITGSDDTMTLVSGTGYPSPTGGVLSKITIEPDSSNEEHVYYDTRSGAALQNCLRGQDGTTARDHSAGAVVVHTLVSEEMSSLSAHLNDTGRNDHTQYLAKSGGTMTGEIVAADQLVSRALLKDYGEEVVAHGAMGSTETFDYSAGNVHTGTLDENVTITISNPTASGDLASLTMILTHDGSGGSTVAVTNGTWVSGSGLDPTLSTTAGAILVISALSVDAGASWLLFYGGSTA